MAEQDVSPEELKALVMMGRKRPMNFAFSPGPKDAHALLIDRRKPPAVLGKLAKKDGGSKVAFGTFTVETKTMLCACERLLPGFAKVLKKHLKSLGLAFKVVVMDADGTVVESDGEDEGDAPGDVAAQEQDGAARDTREGAGGDAASPAAEDPDPKALVQRLRTLQAGLAQRGPEADKLRKAAAMVVSLLKSGQTAKADTTLGAVEAALARMPAAETADAAPAPSAAPDPKALIARAGSVKQQIEALGGDGAGQLRKDLVGAMGLLKARDFAGADTALSALEQSLEDRDEKPLAPDGGNGEAAAGDDPAARKWAATEARLQPEVDRAMQAGRGDLDAINRAFNYAKSQAEAGEYDSAMRAAAQTLKLLKAAADAPANARAEEAADAVPDNVVAYTQSRLNWIKTRSALKADLVKLKMAIEQATKDVEGMEDVPARSGVLLDYLDEIDTSLENTLERLVETPDGSAREALKTEAQGIVSTYRTTLDTPFFQQVDDNGFTGTNIRAAALAALQQVDTALSA